SRQPPTPPHEIFDFAGNPGGGVQIPAPRLRLVADVVADRPSPGLAGDLGASVAEADRAVQPVAAVGTVGQEGKAARELDLQPPLLGMPPDSLVAQVLAGLAVGGDEEPLGLPALTPQGLAQPRRLQVVAQPGQLTSTPGHADSACPQPSLHPGQTSLQPLQT